MVSLEHITPEDWPAVERMRVALQSLVIDTGSVSANGQVRNVPIGIRFGTGSVTFTASTASALASVSHGLGRAPVVVLVQELSGFIRYVPSAFTSTTFAVQGYSTSSTVTTGTLAFLWVVIG